MSGILPVAIAAIGAGVAVGIGGLSSGIGTGITGAAAAGAVAEDPSKFGRAFVFQAIPQTQGIYGLLVALFILMGTGLLGTLKVLTLPSSLVALGAGLAVGIAGMSAIGQGITAAAGIGAITEDESMFGRSIIFSVVPETQAIYGFIISILLLVSGGLLGGKVLLGEGEASGLAEFASAHNLPVSEGFLAMGIVAVGAGLAVGIAGLSAIGQGITCASGIGAVLKSPESFGRSIVLAVVPEINAVFGLLVALLMIVYAGLL